MRARTAVLLLIPLTVTAFAACESDDPTEPERVTRTTATEPVVTERVSLRIEGPELITDRGTYTWIAVTDGDADPETYEWEVLWYDEDATRALFSGPTLTLEVDPERGDLSILLTATSQGRRLVTSREVRTCEGDDGDGSDKAASAIPECLVKH